MWSHKGHKADRLRTTTSLLSARCKRSLQRPTKFEALSYMWGPEDGNHVITLNDFPFQVRRNLREALRFLRGYDRTRKEISSCMYWIDAICINQDDTTERNRQLPIMGQIYFRASTVVVWLGSSYQKFPRDSIRAAPGSGADKKTEDGVSPRVSSLQKEMIRCLQKDKYWTRLWIIQEIGRARHLRVCFGDHYMQWEAFARLINMNHGDGNTGPLRLDRLLRKDYDDSHTLKRLLEDHREAECINPRDKIYGLVGLACDAADSPMDYNKSLYEVWKDTMVLMNRWGLFKEESQILPVGSLIKSLLVADQRSDPWSRIWKELEDQVDSTQLVEDLMPVNPLIFQLEAIVLGGIICIGPSASELVSSPDGTVGWSIAIQRWFPGHELGSAGNEYDKLLSTLLECDDSKVEGMCSSRPSVVTWSGETQNSGDCPPETMGVASGLVKPGDLICWVRSSRRALVVRNNGTGGGGWGPELRVFGTALVTEDMGRLAPNEQFYTDRWMSLERELRAQVKVDASTIFALLE
ncbi:HET-domain-containing protein [Parathielavia hyrcaniae]|uniref:HET-domain-containing protein n=1 Tax=Parathielavia hyrcaniae TaxID=113614 RepID=A0AAN6SZZ1_9PEZI|nr:HET-domain-containing protein [Parathielavia hyrcaniae]